MVAKHEDILVKELAEQLHGKFKQIWTLKKLSASSRFRSRLNSRLGYVPILQPEIDICFLTEKNELYAIEVKLFKAKKMRYDTPFYEGIGQALALHRYGFDAVGLWYLFLEGINTNGINRYGAEAWTFIRNDLHLPLDFSYIAVTNENDKNIFHVMQYTERQAGFKLCRSLDDPLFEIKWRHPNPIRYFPNQQFLREELEWYLNIK